LLKSNCFSKIVFDGINVNGFAWTDAIFSLMGERGRQWNAGMMEETGQTDLKNLLLT
jgi:hypothetical protein